MRYELLWWVLTIGLASLGVTNSVAAEPREAVSQPGTAVAESPAKAAPSLDEATLKKACTANPNNKFDLSTVICIDARNPERPVQLTTEGDEVRPNRTIVVRVLVGTHKVQSISLGGNAGQTIAEVVGSPSDPKASPSSASDASPRIDCLEHVMYCAKFVPRTPGVARLRITLEPAEVGAKRVELDLELFGVKLSIGHGEPPPQASGGKNIDFEYLIPRIYSGAIRAGVSAFYGAHDVAYTSSARGGGAAGLVSELPSARITSEIVVGYAPFPESFTQREGRDYVSPLKWYALHRFAPYLGLGVVGASQSADGGTKAVWLRSGYVGIEYEISEGLSVAATVVLRRAERAADGITPGQMVPSGSALTDTKLMPGIGLVLNLTPDFFKVVSTVGGK